MEEGEVGGDREENNLALGGETHDNAGAGPFQCTRANNRLLNCCKFIRPTVPLY